MKKRRSYFFAKNNFDFLKLKNFKMPYQKVKNASYNIYNLKELY